jgi:putative Holliday junction resolvase
MDEAASSREPVLEIPKAGRLVGIDFGSVRIGLAICDPGQQWVGPLPILHRRNEAWDLDQLRKLAKEERLAGWILGMPLHLDGNESAKMRECKLWSKRLQETTGVPVAWVDERFTTVRAEEMLREGNLKASQRAKWLDSVAAMVILETYLQSDRSGSIQHRSID